MQSRAFAGDKRGKEEISSHSFRRKLLPPFLTVKTHLSSELCLKPPRGIRYCHAATPVDIIHTTLQEEGISNIPSEMLCRSPHPRTMTENERHPFHFFSTKNRVPENTYRCCELNGTSLFHANPFSYVSGCLEVRNLNK